PFRPGEAIAGPGSDGCSSGGGHGRHPLQPGKAYHTGGDRGGGPALEARGGHMRTSLSAEKAKARPGSPGRALLPRTGGAGYFTVKLSNLAATISSSPGAG